MFFKAAPDVFCSKGYGRLKLAQAAKKRASPSNHTPLLLTIFKAGSDALPVSLPGEN